MLVIEAPSVASAVHTTLGHLGTNVTLHFQEEGRTWAILKVSDTFGPFFASVLPCDAYGYPDPSPKAPRSRRGARFERDNLHDARHALTVVIERARKMYRV